MMSNRLFRPMGFLPIVLLLGGSAWSAPAPPPWVVESPSAAGSRFGLGLELLSESQESLDIESTRSVVTSRDLATGRESTTVLDGDAGLLNRKFDLDWQLDGPAVQLPVGLGCFSFLGTRVHPTLTLQAASAGVSLDFLDRPEPDLSTSLEGRSPVWGGGLSLAASLCPGCPWFAGAGYRFSTLSLEADRSPRFAEPGFDVLRDEVRLSQELHEISTRLGYVSANNRFAYHLGLRGRWTGVEIEDELRLASDRVHQETTLSSRTNLDSYALQGVAGMDARLARSLFGRAEVAVGSGDEAVQLKLVYLRPAIPGGVSIHFRSRQRSGAEGSKAQMAENERLLRSIAAALAPQIGLIVQEFRAGWRNLEVVQGPGGAPAYRSAEVDKLLRSTDDDLARTLDQYSELVPLAEWMRDRFLETRQGLGVISAELRNRPSRILPAVARRQAGTWQLAQGQGGVVDKGRADQELRRLDSEELATVRGGRYWTRFTFEASDLGPGPILKLYPKANRFASRTMASGQQDWVVYGNYSFEIYLPDKPADLLKLCDARDKTREDPPCPLTLMYKARLTLRCQAGSCRSLE